MRRRIAAALLAALLLTGCAPAAEPAAEPAEPAGEPVYMALTFDDGPSPAWTPRLLEGLSRRGARATFFLVGSQIEGREDLVRRIRQEGHQIGNHSFGHGDLTDLSAAQALADLVAENPEDAPPPVLALARQARDVLQGVNRVLEPAPETTPASLA